MQHPDRIIVKFKDNALELFKSLAINSAGLELVAELENTGISILEMKDSTMPAVMRTQQNQQEVIATIVEDLNQSMTVEYAEPDYLIKIYDTPDDQGFENLWGLQQYRSNRRQR